MSEIAACTLIQEEPDRKTERYLTMFKDYPDVVTVEHLQEKQSTRVVPSESRMQQSCLSLATSIPTQTILYLRYIIQCCLGPQTSLLL